jgi:hypothetical protein
MENHDTSEKTDREGHDNSHLVLRDDGARGYGVRRGQQCRIEISPLVGALKKSWSSERAAKSARSVEIHVLFMSVTTHGRYLLDPLNFGLG